MNNNWISDLPLPSVEKGLGNAGAELMLWLQRKVSDDLKERLKSEDVADVLGHLQDFCEECLERREDCRFEGSDVIKQIAKLLQDKWVKFVLFVSWQILEDYCGERTK